MNKIFDSRDEAYRSPYGAVTQGTDVNITLCPPRTWGVSKVTIIVWYDDSGSTVEIPMKWSGLRGSQDSYCGAIPTADAIGPLWYHFELEHLDGSVDYYGNNHQRRGGVGQLYESDPAGYQVTVYLPEYSVPEWYGSGITYQIFPDRFRRLEPPKPMENRVIHEDWNDMPVYAPDENGEVLNNDFFGGSLAGVREKLEYLSELGVMTIYFCPVFQAYSNHRYDTGDYMKIDPMLGTEKELAELCKEAREKYGIRVILDGVFNHTGCDSRYFNMRGTYDSLGAYQSKESRFYDWYDFQEWPDKYSSWWGMYTLPQVNETNKNYIDFIIHNRDSVVRRWGRAGVSGWRLDVADELPDEFIEQFRTVLRETNHEAVLIGEVWEDASNKTAYGKRRRYLLGRGLDSVMNYPFRNALIAFLRGGDARDFVEEMECLRENYPKLAFNSLMNLIGTHDSPRILTVLGCDEEDYNGTKDDRALRRLSRAQRGTGLARLKLAAAIQFSFPGSPMLYYGDEAGMEGFEDPLNRLGYPWGGEDKSLLQWYRQLGNARRNSEALRSGEMLWRHAKEGLLVYERAGEHESVIVAVNASLNRMSCTLDWNSKTAVDLMTGRSLRNISEEIVLEVEPMSVMLLLC
ncbi:MAG: glycoside hydrolase family 13 protein [Oscillospiraceae bacterium]|nr:glycoside hydrolase family 13 protein [Oscillospiraceae bacterium]